jgi:phosphate starvation-inducible PhoH-like protein
LPGRADQELQEKLKNKALDLTLMPTDNARLARLCGPLDENLRQIETAFDVTIARRGGALPYFR